MAETPSQRSDLLSPNAPSQRPSDHPTGRTSSDLALGIVSDCQFCEEFQLGYSPLLTPPRSRAVYEDSDFIAVVAIGSFVPGYLLLLPKIHFQSFADLPDHLLSKASRITWELRNKLSLSFGSTVVMEHGSSGEQSGGACLDHAHLHIVAADVKQLDLDDAGVWCRSQDLTTIGAHRGSPYLLFGALDEEILICARPSVRSQYLRRKLAVSIGKPDLWDWAAYFGRDEMQQTLMHFGLDGGSMADADAEARTILRESEAEYARDFI